MMVAGTYPQVPGGDEPVLSRPQRAHHRRQLLCYSAASAVGPGTTPSSRKERDERVLRAYELPRVTLLCPMDSMNRIQERWSLYSLRAQPMQLTHAVVDY